MHRIIYRKLMFILVLIFSFCAVSSGFADDDSKGRFAPLSPKFLKWQKEQQSRSTVKVGLKVQSSESESNSASDIILIPSSSAFVSLDPASSPANT